MTSPAPLLAGDAIPRRSWLTLAVTSTSVFMVSLEITVISLAFPDIREAFDDTDPATLSWVFTAYNIGVASLLLVSGFLADRIGRKRVFLTGLAIFAVGSLGSGMAVSAGMLIACRVVQSLGGSMLYPAGLALLLPSFPPHRQSFAVGVWGAMGGVAAAVGPSVGALLVEAFGWRSVFLINVPVAFTALLVGIKGLAESKGAQAAGRVDLISVPLASVGVGALVLGITKGEAWGWSSPSIIGCFVISVVLLAVFVLRSDRHPRPLFDLALMRLRSYRVSNLGSLFFAVAFFGWLVLLPTFIEGVWGWSVLKTGFAIAPGPLLSGILSGPIGSLADRIGFRPILVVGGISGAISLVLQALLIDEQPAYLTAVLIPSLFLGVSAGCCFAMLVGSAMRDVPPHRYAMAGAGRTTVFQLAVAVGIAIAVAVVGQPESAAEAVAAYHRNWLIGAACMVAMAVLFAVRYPTQRPEQVLGVSTTIRPHE
ncbi:MAG TPA: DHA2 family efflux MFS transporter permease subunit [Acidimicrobiales bacterium]